MIILQCISAWSQGNYAANFLPWQQLGKNVNCQQKWENVLSHYQSKKGRITYITDFTEPSDTKVSVLTGLACIPLCSACNEDVPHLMVS